MSFSRKIKGLEEKILADRGVNISKKHTDCPLCGSKNKFRWNWWNGSLNWICVCGQGDVIRYIEETENKSFLQVAREIEEKYGLKKDLIDIPKRKSVVLPFEKTTGTTAGRYLKNRGIKLIPETSVGHISNQYHHESNQNFDCMYSIATDHRMNPSQAHRTFLQNDWKIPDKPRKLEKINSSENVSVKMFPMDSALGIGEGIESCLSASQVYSIPTWASLNTAFLRKFRAPVGVKVLFVFADNDSHGAGLAAAFECGNKNILCKNDVIRVVIRWPEKGDFNDHLNSPGKIYEWELTR